MSTRVTSALTTWTIRRLLAVPRGSDMTSSFWHADRHAAGRQAGHKGQPPLRILSGWCPDPADDISASSQRKPTHG